MHTTPQGHRGRAVVITGGGSGIGRAAAHGFADAGADVLIVGRTPERLAEAADGRPGIRTYACDISADGAAELITAAALDRLGRIDVLVNNAAVTGGGGALGGITRTEAERVFATNFFAPVLLTQAAAAHIAPGGAVVNVTSMPGWRGWPGRTVYGATKVALDFATHTWAMELAPRGIRVAAVAPGMIATGISANNGDDPERVSAERAALVARVPLHRLGRPEEVAWWIMNLADPAASYATGLVVPVDGGAFVG
ncbi:MAG TPA: SDR family oxidoreductase [Streptosporangiaceae bacterium]|jgi:NAD(P)-dependent dehydrogenase (short-subunit alcohol dehydrogenase family)